MTIYYCDPNCFSGPADYGVPYCAVAPWLHPGLLLLLLPLLPAQLLLLLLFQQPPGQQALPLGPWPLRADLLAPAGPCQAAASVGLCVAVLHKCCCGVI